MADKTIGELDAVKIGSLPVAPDIYDDTLIPVEQQGEARKMTGEQWKRYAVAAAAAQTAEAKAAAGEAQKSQQGAEAAKDEAVRSATDAADSAAKAEDFSGHAPEIREGHWWVWNVQKRLYEDTGVSAEGNVLYATFWIDPDTGDLYMFTPDKYEGPGFRLTENGDLEVYLTHA